MLDHETKNIIKEFDSVSAGAEWIKKNTKHTQAHHANISVAALEKRNHAYGFVWKYADVPDLDGEIWKEVPTNIWESPRYGPYKCSNKGRLVNKYGKLIEGSTDSHGYIMIGGACILMHRIVAFTWISNPEPENNTLVNHKNGIKTDNRVVNLEWTSHSGNTQHAYDIGLSSMAKSVSVVELNSGETFNYKSIKHMCEALVIGRTRARKLIDEEGILETDDGKSYVIFVD